MKNLFYYFILTGLLFTSCTATMHTTSEEQFRDHSFDTASINSEGITLLPIVGTNQVFSSVVSSAADSVFRANEFNNYADNRQVSNNLNNKNLVSVYQEMIKNYNNSGMIDRSPLKQIGEATGTRYLFKIQIGNLNREADTRSSGFDSPVQTMERKNVRLYGLLWDASNGNVVWEGVSTAKASEGEFTRIRQEDKEFYQAATAELIHKLISPLQVPDNRNGR